MKKQLKNQVVILKIGGSIITEKASGKPKIKKSVVTQIVKELKIFTKLFPDAKIILLHGAGSFGHPLVYEYKLTEKPLVGRQLLGFTKTVLAMRNLANQMTEIFISNQLPILPLQTSALNMQNIDHLKDFLDAGFIPMLGGDMGLTEVNKAVVISADRLAILFSKKFPNSKIIFATDVEGVFENFYAENKKLISNMSRKELEGIILKMEQQKSRYDVTGGMAGKLQELLNIKNKEVIIFNGMKAKNLTKALI